MRARCLTLLVVALGVWLDAGRAFAHGSCGSGGVTGERVAVDLESSLYYVTTPAAYTDSDEWPLIIGLHGDEGDPAKSVNWNWRDAFDDTHIFVAPKAPFPATPDANAGSWYEALDENSAWMDTLVAKVLADYNVDLDRVYIWGLSGGSEFVSYYATQRQDVFAAAEWNMGGSGWLYTRAGSSSPADCKMPGRFVVSKDDFLRDSAMELYNALTANGHETEWVDAMCMGHCWDDIESGPGARDWLMSHTLCGEVRPPGCDELPPVPGVDGGAASDPDAGAPDAGAPDAVPTGPAAVPAPVAVDPPMPASMDGVAGQGVEALPFAPPPAPSATEGCSVGAPAGRARGQGSLAGIVALALVLTLQVRRRRRG